MARWNDAVVALIDEQGITQVELARLAGIHPDTVSHVVHGGHCSTETLEKLAAALGVDLGELFGQPADERSLTLKRDRVVEGNRHLLEPKDRRAGVFAHPPATPLTNTLARKKSRIKMETEAATTA